MSGQKIDSGRRGENFGRVFRITQKFLVFDSDGRQQILRNTFEYAALSPNLPQPVNKVSLVTSHAATVNGQVYFGFQDQVTIPLMRCLNVEAQNYGTFVKDLLNPEDYDQQVGTIPLAANPPSPLFGNGIPSTVSPTAFPTLTAGVGNVGIGVGTVPNEEGPPITGGTRLPLTDTLNIRKFTQTAGKNWSRGHWSFAPLDASHVTGDELNSTGQAKWGTAAVGPVGGSATLSLKACLYQPITDGANTLVPIMVSSELSQLRRIPTRVAFAQLNYSASYNYIISGNLPLIIDVSIGSRRHRQQKPQRTDRSDLLA